jgi:glycine dehydrogenase subunit 1
VPFIPLTPDEEREALKVIGVHSVEELFSTVPPKIRENADFKLDPGHGYDSSGRGLTEHEIRRYFHDLSAKNATFPEYRHFLGGGTYDNIVPAIVNQLTLRGEFLTCYTPYQPEVSQGTLQVIFEFQTMISRLTAMDVANASMYDGATAAAEAVLMAQRLGGASRQGVLIAASLPPDYREVINTFLRGHSELPQTIRWSPQGTLDLDHLTEVLKTSTPACLVVPSPNYFGIVEPIDKIKERLPKETLLIVAVSDPSSLSIFEPPGKLGADIVVGEAHQFGTPMLFGGPHVGFFATRREFLRQMPGRLCGESVDLKGRRAYALTLSTREQHIRREKATSNICTNQGLIALRTTIYLSFLGKRGFQRLGETNFSLYDFLAKELEANGIRPKFKNALNYREGVFEVPSLDSRFQNAVQKKIIPGIKLSPRMGIQTEDLKNCLLVCVHPKHTKADLEALVEVLSHG